MTLVAICSIAVEKYEEGGDLASEQKTITLGEQPQFLICASIIQIGPVSLAWQEAITQ